MQAEPDLHEALGFDAPAGDAQDEEVAVASLF